MKALKYDTKNREIGVHPKCEEIGNLEETPIQKNGEKIKYDKWDEINTNQKYKINSKQQEKDHFLVQII